MKIDPTLGEDEIPAPTSHLPVHHNGSTERVRWLPYSHRRKRPGKSNQQRLIRGHTQLRAALFDIVRSFANHDQFNTTSGLYRRKLILAQSLRDQGVTYEVKDILAGRIQPPQEFRSRATSNILAKRVASGIRKYEAEFPIDNTNNWKTYMDL